MKLASKPARGRGVDFLFGSVLAVALVLGTRAVAQVSVQPSVQGATRVAAQEGRSLGVFQGKIVGAPAAEAGKGDTAKGWLYVQGRNGTTRRVNIAKAQISYDDEFPKKERLTRPADSLQLKAEVRITARQDGDGEWQALNVLIISVAEPAPRKPDAAASGNVETAKLSATPPSSLASK